MSGIIHLEGTRFGALTVCDEDVFRFPKGLIGFEQCQNWILLADDQNPMIGWLQCVDRPELALSVVSPRRFVEGYRVRIGSQQLAPLELSDGDRAYVLSIVAKHERGRTMNLKAPVLVNLDRRLGVQVVTRDDQPMQLDFPRPSAHLRKSA